MDILRNHRFFRVFFIFQKVLSICEFLSSKFAKMIVVELNFVLTVRGSKRITLAEGYKTIELVQISKKNKRKKRDLHLQSGELAQNRGVPCTS